MRFLVLDDSAQRLQDFEKGFQRLKNSNVEVIFDFAMTSDQAIEYLQKSTTNNLYDMVWLDHDLGTDDKQKIYDDNNNGMIVADWFCNNQVYHYPNNFGIVIHSWNIPRGVQMKKRLEDSGYHVVHLPGGWNSIGK